MAEKIYMRNNATRQWITNNNGVPIQFSSRRTAKQYADEHLCRFIIVSYNATTKKLKWRGGDRVI